MVVTSYKNPILSGMYPDPSIVRVGDTFYMVNSTFIKPLLFIFLTSTL
ncbi:TPA: family 43 glycosylhydrolase [Streptococcus suis]|nr:family 43 glycosylhydrolase [Streptococcus suis]